MFGRLALHTWTLDTTPLAAAIAAARAGGFDGIELRRIDFVRCHDQGMDNEAVIAMVREQGLPVHMLGCEYGWIFGRGSDNQRLFDVLEESCEIATALDCPLIMVAPGQNSGPVAEAVENLGRGADICGKYGLKLAIEFNSQHPVINGVAPLRAIVAAVGSPHAGMLLDAYHLERAGLGGRGFADVAPEEIFAFQYSDVPAAPVPEGVKRPADRLPPGQGTVRWVELFQLLMEKNFGGYLSYEAPNPEAWARPPAEVCREAADATRALIAQALGVAR